MIESCKIQVERGEQRYSILKVARLFEEYGKGGLQGRRYGKKEGEWVGKKKVKVRLGKVRSVIPFRCGKEKKKRRKVGGKDAFWGKRVSASTVPYSERW